MLDVVIPVCLALLGVAAVLTVVRLFVGPDLPDRVLALGTLYINALALIVLFRIWLASGLVFVAALVIVIPRSCSWTIQSMVAAPSWTSPSLCVLPV